MYKSFRLALVVGLGAIAAVASAQVNFTLIAGYYILDSSGPFNFNFLPNGPTDSVNFTPSAPALKVGDSTSFGSGVGTIIYTVSGNTLITGIDMTIQGAVNQWGEINWSETAESASGNLGILNGTVRGSSYSGGADGAFTQVAHLTFSQPVTSFTVKKTFDLDIAANLPPSQSMAAVTLVEQNLTPVPEPASLAAIGLGASALLARRRKK